MNSQVQTEAMKVPKITAIERTVCCVPFTPRCETWNSLLVRNWRIVEIIQVSTDAADIVGIGETVIHYGTYFVTSKVTEFTVNPILDNAIFEIKSAVE